MERGARRADRMLSENLAPAYYCVDQGYVTFSHDDCRGSRIEIGPLWRGALADGGYLSLVELKVNSLELATAGRLKSLLTILRVEAPLTSGLLAYSIEGLASAAKTSMPRRDALIEELRRLGYRAVRSHLSPTTIRSDAPPGEVAAAVARLGSRYARRPTPS